MSTRTRFDSSTGALWASAFVIAALIVTQAGRLNGNRALAGDTTTRGDYAVLTASSGTGGDEDPEELLYIIDSRDGSLLVYEIEDARKRQMTMRAGFAVSALFAQGRN